jgi:hypothetical protein
MRIGPEGLPDPGTMHDMTKQPSVAQLDAGKNENGRMGPLWLLGGSEVEEV